MAPYVTASIHLDGVIRTAIILTTLEAALRIHVFLICRATTMVLLKNIYILARMAVFLTWLATSIVSYFRKKTP